MIDQGHASLRGLFLPQNHLRQPDPFAGWGASESA